MLRRVGRFAERHLLLTGALVLLLVVGAVRTAEQGSMTAQQRDRAAYLTAASDYGLCKAHRKACSKAATEHRLGDFVRRYKGRRPLLVSTCAKGNQRGGACTVEQRALQAERANERRRR